MPKATPKATPKVNIAEFAARALEGVNEQLRDMLNLAIDYKANIIDKLGQIVAEQSELRSLLGITILLGVINLLLTIGMLLFK